MCVCNQISLFLLHIQMTQMSGDEQWNYKYRVVIGLEVIVVTTNETVTEGVSQANKVRDAMRKMNVF